MSTCSECNNYDPIDGVTGKCKFHPVARHMTADESHLKDVVNGWPTVESDEPSCREFEA